MINRLLSSLNKNHAALFIAVLFHVSGFVGIIFSSHREWFIQNTPLNLCLMFALLVWTQLNKNLNFFLFVIIVFVTGIITEIIGINTAILFGNYQYLKILGPQLTCVPLIIGLNWFIIIYCAGITMQHIHFWIEKKYASAEIPFSTKVQVISFVFDGALFATFFDWLMEPAAIKLGFWKWLSNGDIPLLNYASWFAISIVLLTVFHQLKFNKHNHFAVHLFIIQLLFFMALRTFL
jgi:putative membrane protein